MLKTEFRIPKTLYWYAYDSEKSECIPETCANG